MDMFYLMQKYGTKREFIKDSEHRPETSMSSDDSVASRPRNLGFVVKFSLSGAYQALERQELEASVPQIAPVKIIRKRTILVKRPGLSSIPEGTMTRSSARGTPEMSRKTPGGSVVTVSTNAKSKRSQVLDQLKAQNQEKIVWKDLKKKTEPLQANVKEGLSGQDIPNEKNISNSPRLLKRQTSKHNLLQRQSSTVSGKTCSSETITPVEKEGNPLESPRLLKKKSTMHNLLQREASIKFEDESLDKSHLPEAQDGSASVLQLKSEVDTTNETKKNTKVISKKQDTAVKPKTPKHSSSKGETKGGKDKKGVSGKTKNDDSGKDKLEKKASKKNLLEEEDRLTSRTRRKLKSKTPELTEPIGSKLYQTMMGQTLGGKRPDENTDDDTSMNTLVRFLVNNTSSADEETVTASDYPASRLSHDPGSMTGSAHVPREGKKRSSVISEMFSEKVAGKGTREKDSATKERKAPTCASEEDREAEQRRRKVSKYLYHMCNCRYIAKPETLRRLVKQKQNVGHLK